MLKHYACTSAELSCIIGNLFVELAPPCDHCGEAGLTITGLTVTGNTGTLFLTSAGFDFEGCAEDTVIIDRIRKGRCINAKAGTRQERTFGIQCNCEMQRFDKAHIHDHKQHGAISEEVSLHTCKQDTG